VSIIKSHGQSWAINGHFFFHIPIAARFGEVLLQAVGIFKLRFEGLGREIGSREKRRAVGSL
jgi:hypothetical protein